MIHWGFIGCGSVVEYKSGKPFWLEGKSDIAAVMCRNLDSAKDFATRHNIAEYGNDAEALINNPNVDAIYIATPPSTHMPYAKLILEAGKPVYVEKPMGLNVAECEEIVALAEEKNLPLYVAFYRRGLPHYQAVKKMVDAGEIGTVRSVNILQCVAPPTTDEGIWRRDPAIAGGGLFHDLGCHTFDILDYILGPIAQASGNKANQRKLYNSDDTVCAQFTFESGVLGSGLWCFDVSEEEERVQIIGDEGRIEFSVYYPNLKLIKNGVTQQIEIPHPAFIQEPLIHNMIANLRGEEEALSTGTTALRTVKVMEQIVG